jgi:hypothetical protein
VYARVPPQAAPPVGEEPIAKSPLIAELPSVTEVPEATRLVNVNICVPLELCSGTEPKSWAAGVRSNPVSGNPVPVNPSTYGEPCITDAIVSVPGCGPAAVGKNCTPSQQLWQLPVVVEAYAEADGVPGPNPASSTRTALYGPVVVTVNDVNGCATL